MDFRVDTSGMTQLEQIALAKKLQEVVDQARAELKPSWDADLPAYYKRLRKDLNYGPSDEMGVDILRSLIREVALNTIAEYAFINQMSLIASECIEWNNGGSFDETKCQDRMLSYVKELFQ